MSLGASGSIVIGVSPELTRETKQSWLAMG